MRLNENNYPTIYEPREIDGHTVNYVPLVATSPRTFKDDCMDLGRAVVAILHIGALGIAFILEHAKLGTEWVYEYGRFKKEKK